jgi:hypothetical protein
LYEITPETQHALGGWDSSKAHSYSSAVCHYPGSIASARP